MRLAAELDLREQGVESPHPTAIAAAARRKALIGERGCQLGLDHLPGLVRCEVLSGPADGLARDETFVDARTVELDLADVREHVGAHVTGLDAVMVRVRPARLIDRLAVLVLWWMILLGGRRGP
jgi:hypothetical protein